MYILSLATQLLANSSFNSLSYLHNKLNLFKFNNIFLTSKKYSLEQNLYCNNYQFLINNRNIYKAYTNNRYFTKHTEPQKTSVRAILRSKHQDSPNIATVLFDVLNPNFTFKPGQWCDVYVPKLESPEYQVAGFSMISSPLLKNQVEFSVKLSKHPIALYIHNTIKPGDEILIDGGYGDFYYTREMSNDIVLIAGGIGITPLMSILQYVYDAKYMDVKVNLLHSAVSSKELLFRNKIQNIQATNSNIHYIPTITKQDNEYNYIL